MEKKQIMNKVKENMPSSILNGTIKYQNRLMSFEKFLDNYFINALKPGASSANILKYIEKNYYPHVDIISEKLNYIKEFKNSRFGFFDIIKTGPNTFFNVNEYFEDYVLNNLTMIDGEWYCQVGSRVKTLDEVYNGILRNTYRVPTKLGKIESIVNYVSLLETNIALELMPDINSKEYPYLTYLNNYKTISNLTLYESLINYLPYLMVNETDVLINEETIYVSTFINDIVLEYQRFLTSIKEQEIQNRINENNFFGETLDDMFYIDLIDNEGVVEVTGKIPVVKSAKLENNEKKALSRIIDIDKEDYFKTQIINLITAIITTNSKLDLESNKRKLKRLKMQIDIVNINKDSLETYLRLANSYILKKEQQLIKVSGNKEDIIDNSFGETNEFMKIIRSSINIDDFDKIKSQEVLMHDMFLRFDIKDIQILNALSSVTFESMIRRYALDSSIPNISRIRRNLKNQIDLYLLDIKKGTFDLRFEKGDLNLISVDTNLRNNISNIEELIDLSLANGYMSVKEANMYQSILEYYKNEYRLIGEYKEERKLA